MREKSEIDELFFRLMGYYSAKAGQAYEMISASALGIVKALIAEHNKFMKGGMKHPSVVLQSRM